MSYKHKTDFYKIPSIGEGDKLSASEELKAARIIENQLLGATKGVLNAVFEEGEYKLICNQNNTFSVILIGTGEKPTLEGIVGGGYCYSKRNIVWDDLQFGHTYYLYVGWTENLFEVESSFSVLKKEGGPFLNNFRALLLAKLDIKQGFPKLDIFPDGKIYSRDIAVHANDVTNPHGENQIQDTITLRKSLMFEQINEDGSIIPVVLYDGFGNGLLKQINKNKIIFIDGVSGGSNGVNIQVEGIKEIKGVIVQEKIKYGKPPTFALGEVVSSFNENKLIIYNNGRNEISINIIVFGE